MFGYLKFRGTAAIASTLAAAWLLTVALGAQAADDPAQQRAPKPTEFASVFSFGYGSDLMPKDDARYEELLKKLKQAGFNVLHGSHSDSRLALCKKHGFKLMVDLLDVENHHVYKSADKAKAICEKLRGNPDVWGYNIWNDVWGKKTYTGRIRDVNTVRGWDPTHPAYCGAYRTYGVNHLSNADMLGYYDFHWDRQRGGPDQHFGHLQHFLGLARNFNANYYTWLAAAPGTPGDEGVHRSLWSANTGMACGLKGVLWFLGQSLMNKDTLEWTPAGQDMPKVHAEIMPLKSEILKVGLPTAVYVTKITKTLQNQPLPGDVKEMPAPGLPPVPADFWAQPAGGEFVLGVFKNAQGQDALFVANHNAYAEQRVTLKLAKPRKASLFNRNQGQWQPLEAKDGAISFPLSAGGGELLRFEG